MTDGQIWSVMLELKVFTPAMVLEKLNPPPYLRRWVKEKVKNLITQQLKNNILRVVVEDPPVFSTEDATPEDIENFKRTCPICGRKFFPSQRTQEFCSTSCRQKHYKNYHRQRRKKLGMKLDSRRRWTRKEVEKAIKLKAQGKTYKEIATILGRTPEGVKDKLKRLKKEGVLI